MRARAGGELEQVWALALDESGRKGSRKPIRGAGLHSKKGTFLALGTARRMAVRARANCGFAVCVPRRPRLVRSRKGRTSRVLGRPLPGHPPRTGTRMHLLEDWRVIFTKRPPHGPESAATRTVRLCAMGCPFRTAKEFEVDAAIISPVHPNEEGT